MSSSSKKQNINLKPTGIIVIVVLLLVIFLFLLIKLLMPKTFVVSFDSLGGTVVNAIKVKENGHITKPNDPTREGYNFAGWYLDGELFDFDTKINESIVLEARWSGEGISVTKIVLEKSEVTLKINESSKIKYTLEPDNATDKTILFTSSDKTVAIVDTLGNIKGLKEGEAVITLTTSDGKIKATLKVIVSDEEVKVVLPTSVSITGNSTVVVGKTIKLTANVKPTDATNKEVVWSSSNESIATVDQNGNVKALKAGTVTVTVTTVEGNKKATKKITIKAESTSVNPPEEAKVEVTGIKISGNKEVIVGSKLKLTAQVIPDNATSKEVIWSSSDESIATVDQSGNVLGKTSGTVIITATSKDGKASATYEITVKEKEPVYILYLKAIIMDEATGSISQYSFRVTKNDTDFTGYNGFTYNNKTTVKTSGTIRAVDIDKNVKTATIILPDGSKVNAEVRYE